MQPIVVPTVLGIEDWLAEELPEVRRFDDPTPGSWVLLGADDDRGWEFTGDDEFDSLDVPAPRISADFVNDLTI